MELKSRTRNDGLAMADAPQASFVERLADRLGQNASARTVFGDPVERDGVTVIPVAHVRYGFGGGGGKRTGNEGGGGFGGFVANPIGFIEIKNGQATFRAIQDPSIFARAATGGAVLGFLLMRQLLHRIRR